MRTEVIEADTIYEAVQRILKELEEDDDAAAGGTAASSTTTTSRHNVIYFDGWDGLGASAVLREVGRRLTARPDFSQIIHIDCSKWESRRAMQRALAEQLQLPRPVMEMFDAQDEEDDYNGVDQGSRLEIPKVAREIYQHVQKQPSHRFLVIFNNGGCEEIDLESSGFPLSGYSRNKLLWSFQGGFRLYDRMKVDEALKSTRATTDVVVSADSSSLTQGKFSDILRHEAEEVAGGMNSTDGIDWPAAAANCFLYTMRLCGMGGLYDLATHICNYWRCDGVIQLRQGDAATDDGVDTLWQSSDDLKRKMQLDADYHQSPHSPSPVARRLHERIACWTSPTYGSMLIPSSQCGRIPNGMFQQYDNLSVLKLSACAFSFKAPPFLCCHSLRFLWLDHCRDDESRRVRVGNREDLRRFFQRLWVLDMRYSSSTLLSKEMMDFMTQLRELNVMGQDTQGMSSVQERRTVRKLRITKSRTSGVFWFSASGNDKMELLDFSGNSGYMGLHVESSCSSLETIIIDGSSALEVISFKGCAKLKNLFLSGLFPRLSSLDITGTAVKTLDLNAVAAPKLDELLLLDCGKLFAIRWPPQDKRKRYLDKLRIDTTQKEGSTTVTAQTAAKGRLPVPAEFSWYISARDARLLGSLGPVKDYFGPKCAHVDISTTPPPSPTHLHADVAGGNDRGDRIKSRNRKQVQGNLQRVKCHRKTCYADVTDALKDTSMQQQQADEGDHDVWAVVWVCPAPPKLEPEDCYTHIEDQMTKAKLQTARIAVPGFMCDGARILHVHNSLFISSIVATPLGSSWNELKWCRVERCPKLECVFSPQFGEAAPEGNSSRSMDIFRELRTIWVSHLPNARHVLEYPSKEPLYRAFTNLTLLHIYCCPRLVHAIPFPSPMMSWESLETLEIMWCGDLRVVIKDYTTTSGIIFIGFPRLKHIHLHELPMLQGILGPARFPIFAPYLETVKIRGCWGLKTMPFDVGKNLVECDCEKDWWDRLKWRSREHASHYKPIHPRYYKKTMLRGSPLR